ncbi:universal stress protein (plasmid) [Halorussus limi]|uniref:Universal stress protein n=1 Tax=Halorussus limi TaxID=2938695 RepID=A0A8U0I0J0_9EURY|nr:universal stress protein [Halorussus limi]UPV76688.1 universal stress protein [Halorussus limi]
MVGEDTIDSEQRREAWTVLVPVRYPLREEGIQTLRGAVNLAESHPEASLVILHVNLRHAGHSITSTDLQATVEAAVGPLTATYVVREGYLLEDEILAEAYDQKADCIALGTNHVPRREWLVRRLLGPPLALGTHLQRHANPPIEVVEIDQ